MKIGVVSQVLGPLLQADKLLQLRVSYNNEPSNSRPVWLIGFESGLAHCYFSIAEDDAFYLEEGWENVELWSNFIVCHDSEFQQRTKDELLIALATEYKKAKANRQSFFEQLQERTGSTRAMQ